MSQPDHFKKIKLSYLMSYVCIKQNQFNFTNCCPVKMISHKSDVDDKSYCKILVWFIFCEIGHHKERIIMGINYYAHCLAQPAF